jgi:hypothetical protein
VRPKGGRLHREKKIGQPGDLELSEKTFDRLKTSAASSLVTCHSSLLDHLLPKTFDRMK